MKDLQKKSRWVGQLVQMLNNQKALVHIIRNVRATPVQRTSAFMRYLVQGIVLFFASPFIILFATPVNAFPLIARQRKEGTWTYSYSEFSSFQDRARILFFAVLLAALIVELYLVFR